MSYPPLKLRLLAGPQIPPLVINAEECLIGRGASCAKRLVDDAVSRRHAMVTRQGGEWFVEDLGSRHGTHLNNTALSPNEPTPLRDGDLLRITPWVFRVEAGTQSRALVTTSDDATKMSTLVRAPRPEELSELGGSQLDLLLEMVASLREATDEASIARMVVEGMLRASGFGRVAVIRSTGDASEVEIIDQIGLDGPGDRFSRSLLRAAAGGRIAVLDEGFGSGVSIATLGIHAAVCAPVMVDDVPDWYLYLDARGRERKPYANSASVCNAFARLTAFALSNHRRTDLQRRHEQMLQDIRAARAAQELIMPASGGVVGPVRYAFRSEPGRGVAGDLFDAVPIDGSRTAVILGDVTGKGVGASIVMSTAQSMLHALLRRGVGPVESVQTLNAYFADRRTEGRFVTLWVGVWDASDRTLTSVDAGHGNALRVGGSDPEPRRLPDAGGMPIGVAAAAEYESSKVLLEPGERIVVFSDGITEQRDGAGEMFGLDRTCAVLGSDAGPHEDVQALFRAVRAFAGTDQLGDDATIASVEWSG